MTFKFQGFVVGQVIRAQDFEPRLARAECAVECVIEAVNVEGTSRAPFAHYVTTCTRDIWRGVDQDKEHSRVGQTVYVPMESTFDWDGRVTLVGQEG